jgi:hypothetical protein
MLGLAPNGLDTLDAVRLDEAGRRRIYRDAASRSLGRPGVAQALTTSPRSVVRSTSRRGARLTAGSFQLRPNRFLRSSGAGEQLLSRMVE